MSTVKLSTTRGSNPNSGAQGLQRIEVLEKQVKLRRRTDAMAPAVNYFRGPAWSDIENAG
jgi:hypothetical protein